MRSTIAWSYDLLSERDRQVFRWLSVFVGGFTLRAAEATVAALHAATGQTSASGSDIVELLGSLIANNLLHKAHRHNRDGRYAMLEVVREFGLEMLLVHDELTVAQRAHAAWYASIREWLDPNRFAPGERLIDHLWDIDAEHPNIRAALARSAALGDAGRVLEIAGQHRGLLAPSRASGRRASLARAGSRHRSSTRRQKRAVGGSPVWGSFAGHKGTQPPPNRCCRRRSRLQTSLGHLELRALSLHVLALTRFSQGNVESARIAIECGAPALAAARAPVRRRNGVARQELVTAPCRCARLPSRGFAARNRHLRIDRSSLRIGLRAAPARLPGARKRG